MSTTRHRIARALGRAGSVLSLGLTLSLVLATDVTILRLAEDLTLVVPITLLVLHLGSILLALVGGIIEWRRPGHRIGWLLLLGGPLYAALAAGWTTAGLLEPYVDRDLYLALNWAVLLLSYAGIALIVGWLPLLFPTGTLPGPRWRLPAAVLLVLPTIGTVAWAVRPGPMVEGVDLTNPFGLVGWPTWLQPFIDLIPLGLVALLMLAAAGLAVRYRRGRTVEHLQIRWLLASTSLMLVGFSGVFVEWAIRSDPGMHVSVIVGYAGILAMPIAIGVAVLRYRLYEIDRIISRTIGWAIITGGLLGIFAVLVVGLQALLDGVTQGDTLPVALSTLVAAALFQPIRRRVQHAVDRRFDRARYDGERTAAAFAERLRDEVDLEALADDLRSTVGHAVRPAAASVWLVGSGRMMTTSGTRPPVTISGRSVPTVTT